MTRPLFRNREDAALALAGRLAAMKLAPPLVLLALPRGGVPMAALIATRLGAALDLLLVRKIGAPWQPELAVAAVVDCGQPEVVVDETLAAQTGADAAYIRQQTGTQWQEILRRRALYLGGRAPVPVQGATVILVDDGVATGTTVRAALKALRRCGAARLVLAVPVAPRETLAALRGEFDDVVCLAEPEPFLAVGAHYVEFAQVDDGEVLAALRAADAAAASR